MVSLLDLVFNQTRSDGKREKAIEQECGRRQTSAEKQVNECGPNQDEDRLVAVGAGPLGRPRHGHLRVGPLHQRAPVRVQVVRGEEDGRLLQRRIAGEGRGVYQLLLKLLLLLLLLLLL